MVASGGAGAGVAVARPEKASTAVSQTGDTWSRLSVLPREPGHPETRMCVLGRPAVARGRKPAALSRAVMGWILVPHDGWDVLGSTVEAERQDAEKSVGKISLV